MVVVVIITALAALAIPSIIRQMRDRRTRQAAEEIASLYRQARLRALGRGSAVMVRYRSSDNGFFEVREAVLGGAGTCAALPTTNCASTLWDQDATKANGSKLITQFNPAAGVYDGVTSIAHASQVGGSPQVAGLADLVADTGVANLDVCFTPMGRTLFRTTGTISDPLAPMTGVPAVTVSRNTGGLTRIVLIPPNGLARTDVSQ